MFVFCCNSGGDLLQRKLRFLFLDEDLEDIEGPAHDLDIVDGPVRVLGHVPG